MYGFIWRALPGSLIVRALLALVLIAAVVYACFTWLFPAIAPYMPFNDSVIETAGGASMPAPHTGRV